MKPFAHLLTVVAFTFAGTFTASTALASEAPQATNAAKAAKADAAKGEASYNTVCAACHGTGGQSSTPANPKLAGQHAAYINKQLTEFKSGKRANAIMSGMVAALSPEDMLNISAYLAKQTAKPGFAKDKDLVMLGERIYRGGIPERQIPACSGCHSPNGAGIPDQYPRLAGQHADYTSAQLTAFREGARNNNASMTLVATKLNNKEIQAVSDYIAGLR
jgi:cytochrome c553